MRRIFEPFLIFPQGTRFALAVDMPENPIKEALGAGRGTKDVVSNAEAGANGRGWSKWVMKLALTLVVTLAVVLLADRLFNPEKFQIDNIVVKGEFKHVDGVQVTKVVESYLVGNYFSQSLPRLESKIEQLPWVFSAALRRSWPSTIQVEISEVNPLAKWGDDKWVHFTGDLVERQDDVASMQLPLIHGPEKDRNLIWGQFKRWSALFSANGLLLNALTLSEGNLWRITVSLGALAASYNESGDESASDLQAHSVVVVVEQTEAQEKIQRLIDVLKQVLVPSFHRIRSIDLRYPNGFAIGWVDELGANQNAEAMASESK